MMGFIGGHEARMWEERPGRRAAAPPRCRTSPTSSAAEALSPREVVEINWSAEPWNRGCPVAVLGPGTLTDFGAALRVAGRPHPLGRHRDLDLLERLHGRRGALGRARGERGLGAARVSVDVRRRASTSHVEHGRAAALDRPPIRRPRVHAGHVRRQVRARRRAGRGASPSRRRT